MATRVPSSKTRVLAGAEADMFDVTGERLERHGEERRGEHLVQRRLGALAGLIAAEDAQCPLLLEDRREERQPGDMVVVEMAEQEIGPAATGPERRHGPASRFEPAAGIDDEDALAEPDLDAARVAAIDHRGWPRHGKRAARAPKAHGQIAVLAGLPLRHHGRTTVAPSIAFCHPAARSSGVSGRACDGCATQTIAQGRAWVLSRNCQATARTLPRQDVADIRTMLKGLGAVAGCAISTHHDVDELLEDHVVDLVDEGNGQVQAAGSAAQLFHGGGRGAHLVPENDPPEPAMSPRHGNRAGFVEDAGVDIDGAVDDDRFGPEPHGAPRVAEVGEAAVE